MIVEALTVLFMLAAAVAGAVMLARAMLRGSEVSAIRCGECGDSAENFTSFICPRCGADVREVGLASTVSNSPAARFFKAMALTLVVFLLAPISQQLLRGFIPRTNHRHSTRTMYPISGAFEVLELDCRLAETSGEVRGRLVADLSMPSGRMHSMEIEVPTRRHWTSDEYGQRTERGMFTETTLREWMTSVGVDDSDAKVSDAIAAIHAEMQLVMSDMDPRPFRRAGAAHYSGGSSSSGSSIEAAWFAPATMMSWAVVWLLGLAWLLRDRKPAQAARVEAVA